MRLSDGSFAPPTWAESLADSEWESDIDKAVGMTEQGREYDPLNDMELLADAVANLSAELRQELSSAYHMGLNERFGELLAQVLFKEAFSQAWASMRPDDEVPDVG